MARFHLNERGEAGKCSAVKAPCPFGSPSMHHETPEAAREAYEAAQSSSFNASPLEFSHGQWVLRGEVEVSGFLKAVVSKSEKNSRFSHSFEELASLTKANLHRAEPGTGSEDGDVLLVPVPVEGFNTNIVEITDQNRHLLEEVWEARVEGEAPVMRRVLRTVPLSPAKVVKIVTYRADVLAKDNDRSSRAEWEIVACLAQPQAHVPMHPTTMERNSSNAKGGTLRKYSEEEWAEARDFWSRHAFADEGAS